MKRRFVSGVGLVLALVLAVSVLGCRHGSKSSKTSQTPTTVQPRKG
ncbi:hypothetical protein HRbin17_02015 [bacterium HR17]|uniref:Uncharacterized protein n=1 Tax=Candidatus Fervidibacter japonicus TaxID=2035412 RepID=A0A2H5XE83_9BACT|nr:hypothetical protein HRbin17_02015 [bacterium HR17]